jgi:hypothetical protein
MGVFLFLIFQVFADAPVPELLFRVQLRTGTVVTVRLVTNASHVTHHLVKNDAYELVGGAAVARPIRMMMSDLVQLPSSLMDRSGLVVLPSAGAIIEAALLCNVESWALCPARFNDGECPVVMGSDPAIDRPCRGL